MLLIKGQGVVFEDPDTGEKIPMTFPENEDFCPFYLHPITGELIDQDRWPHRWPIEGIAHKIALDIAKVSPGINPHTALMLAKELMNNSAHRFNARMRAHGDYNHTIDPYFDEDGKLTPTYKTNNYGNHPGYDKTKNSEDVPTKNDNGTITMFSSNKPNKKLGGDRFPQGVPFPEAAALWSFRELREELDSIHTGGYTSDNKPKGIPSRIGGTVSVDPQDFVLGINGEPGPVTRVSSTGRDPFAWDSMNTDQLASRAPVDAKEILGGLDPSFYAPKHGTEALSEGGVEAVVGKFLDRGFEPEVANRMANAKVGSFFNSGKVRGKGSAVNNTIRDLKRLVMGQTGMPQDVLETEMRKLMYGYVASGMQDLDIDNGNGTKLLESLAISQIAEYAQVNADPVNVDDSVRQAYIQLVNDSPAYLMDRTDEAPRVTNVSHMVGEYPASHAQTLPMDQSNNDQFQDGPGRSYGEDFNQDTLVETSTDTLHVLMESLQMADARMDEMIMKSIPQDRDYESLAKEFSLTVNDVRTIEHARGDWDRIAKSLIIDPLVVRVVKVSLG